MFYETGKYMLNSQKLPSSEPVFPAKTFGTVSVSLFCKFYDKCCTCPKSSPWIV